MAVSSSSSSSGMGICGLLGVVFIVLKLCGVIGWSWWWVTAPFWIPLALVAVGLVGLGMFMLGGYLIFEKGNHDTDSL